jgi:hypothetical protein
MRQSVWHADRSIKNAMPMVWHKISKNVIVRNVYSSTVHLFVSTHLVPIENGGPIFAQIGAGANEQQQVHEDAGKIENATHLVEI